MMVEYTLEETSAARRSFARAPLLLAMLRMRTKERPTARELLTSAHLAPAVATIDPQALAHVVRAAPPPPPPTRRVVVARRVG